MPPRGEVAKHIVGRVEQARRLDPTLTYKRAARELGISLSSLSKMRAGTRTGQGSIRQRVMEAPKRPSDQRPQSVANVFNVRFRTADGTRTASRTISVEGATSGADALAIRHDPETKRAIRRQLARETAVAARRERGSPPWTKRQRDSIVIEDVTRVVRSDVPYEHIHLAQFKR